MIKVISLLKRKAGLSRDDLIRYYENNHAPLIQRLVPQIVKYKRNFVDLTDIYHFGGVIDFDVITEIWFANTEGYEAFRERCAEPAIAQQIAEDEEHVFDRTMTRLFLVDERESVISD